MDKKECTMGKNSMRKMIIALMLMLGLGAGQVVAQNEVMQDSLLTHKKGTAVGGKSKLPNSSSQSTGPEGLAISDSIAVSDSLLHPQNSFIFENPNKSIGVSIFDSPSPYANSIGSIEELMKKERMKHSPYRFHALQAMIPATLFVLGKIGEESDWCKARNKEIRDELQEHVGGKFTIDDFSQYAPLAATYGLNFCGIKGTHGYGDLTIITGTAYALMGITVNTLKRATKVMRPDGSSRNSFPSGHTATAFMGAELLRREYKDVSPWIGVAGYAVAAGTGFFRMYNNRHWLTDVIAGAGIGIMSVQAAYWLYPVISKTFFRKRYLKNTFISPYVSEEGKGLACNITF